MRLYLMLSLIFLFFITISSATVLPAVPPEEITRLLSRLDLSQPGLYSVKQATTPEEAAETLLSYYRSRTTVKHPIDPAGRLKSLGNVASNKDLQWANDALKHVFVGQSSYPAYFCGDDIDWSQSPVPDKEWIWQLHRMYFWGAMARAYWHTGDEKYAEEWARQLKDWVRKNPRDKDHEYAWRSIEAGIRGHIWTEHFYYFLHSPAFTPDVLVTFLNSCFDHAEYLKTKYSRKSNWGLMEAEGMAFIALTFPEFKNSEEWVTEAVNRLNQEIHNQVYPDGHQRELAIGYHTGCIEWFKRTYLLAEANGRKNLFTPAYTTVIEKMCEIPMKLTFPNGVAPQFGDAWSGEPGQYFPLLRKWAHDFNRSDFLYIASEGKEGKKPDSTAYALPVSGLYSMRSGWQKDDICLVLKCGPDGGAHSQPDNGTFELYAGGRQLMPDAGSYIYSGDPEGRAWFRQTAIHQTLTLDSANTRYAPKQLLWQPGENLDILVVENASYENLTHRRSVFFVDKKYFVVVDEATGNATGNVDIHFQLAPGEAVYDRDKFAVRSNFTDGWNVLVKAMPVKRMELTPEHGQVSFVYTKKEPRPAFRYRQKKTSKTEAIRFVTIVAPYERDVPNVKAKVKSYSPIASGRLSLEVIYNGRSRALGYEL